MKYIDVAKSIYVRRVADTPCMQPENKLELEAAYAHTAAVRFARIMRRYSASANSEVERIPTCKSCTYWCDIISNVDGEKRMCRKHASFFGKDEYCSQHGASEK